jgi:hypothetical protein
VAAVSSSGSRLLVVLEDAAEKSKYSKFWTELEGETDLHTSLLSRYMWYEDVNMMS